ncbi:MAG: TIGR02281 family clan AA aspartic protease [Marinomonas sp.]
MLGRTLIFGAGAIALGLGIALPSDEQGAESDISFGPAASEPSASSDWYAGDHTLKREFDGHFYADAHIEGTSMRMLVDTGASVIALTGDDARAAGLDWDDSEVRNIGTGASGAVYGVPVQLNDVEIGGMARSNVRAVIIPEGLDISLLGQSYLSQIGRVEIEGDTMLLGA